ncbi:Coiled-coil-helix-coiled-coil-helix domain-containing protein 5 [Actinomortierella ambigua]|nr:Coiled-coil-helix-coiled-coil-helix domain-containing protein 5 [Actinomortierella ambigua]
MDVADETVALVAKHCGLQLEMYQRCVTDNPENWDMKCITQKRALAKCSEDNVPIIKHVKEMCDPFIRDYDACVMQNQVDPSVCLEPLKRLFYCTEEHGKLRPGGPPRPEAASAAASTASASAAQAGVDSAAYGYRRGTSA